MTSAQAVQRIEKIAVKFAEDHVSVEHLIVKVHRGMGGDFYVEEEWDWKG